MGMSGRSTSRARRGLAIGEAIDLDLGPFSGVYDSPDTGESRRTRLFDLLNMVIPDMGDGSAVLARHGMVGSTTQLGDATSRNGQGVFQHRRLNGMVDRFTFGGGRMYRWDGDSTYTEITTPATSSVKIDASNAIYCASYNGQVILSDEQNKPWVYDPDLDTATVIELDDSHNEWTTKGGPVIYGGKVFFVLAKKGAASLTTEDGIILTTESGLEITTELLSGLQNTIVWCEELTPLIGYSQGDYDNLWTLVQSGSEILGGLSGEEGALVYFRNKGIGSITGTVAEDFRASATRDTISTTIGTDAPAAIISINRRIYFVDMDGRVHRCLVGGGEPQQLWYPNRRVVDEHADAAANRADVVSYARAAYHEQYGLVLFTIWDRRTIYAFDAESGVFVGTLSIGGDAGAGIHVDAMGSMIDANNRATFLILGSRTTTRDVTTQGVVWRQKHADDDDQWLDQADEGSSTMTPLVRAAESHWLTISGAYAFRALQVEAQLLGDTSAHDVGLEYIVPASGKSAKITARSRATVGEKSDLDSISTARWSPGKNAQGNGIRLRLSATHADNVRFGINTITAHCTVTKLRPGGK